MTFAEFAAVMKGFGRFHGAKDETEVVTDDDFAEILAQEMAAGRA